MKSLGLRQHHTVISAVRV